MNPRESASAAMAIEGAAAAASGIDVAGIAYGPSTQKALPGTVGCPAYYPFLAGFACWSRAQTIVEIGSHAGGSTLALRAGQVAAETSDMRFVTVDVTDLNRASIEAAGVIKLVGDGASPATLDAIAECLDGRPIDLLFIDGAKERGFALSVLRGLAQRCGVRWALIDDVRTRSTIATLWSELVDLFGSRAADVSAVRPDMRESEYGLGVVDFGEDGPKVLSGDRYSRLPFDLPRPFNFTRSFPDVPRMMRPREISLLHNIARDWVKGDGAIVDAGCFLGASTLGLASALNERPDRERFLHAIHVYDMFLNERGYFDRYLKGVAKADESWLPQFLETVAPFAKYLNVYPGDFARKRWVGDPIEVLFVDIAKSRTLNAHVYAEFMPWLEPGRSIYVQQDFVHLDAPWIQVVLGQVLPYLEILGVEPPSLVLGLRQPIPERLVRRIQEDDFTTAERIDGLTRLYEALPHEEAKGTMLAIAATTAFSGGDVALAHDFARRRRDLHPSGDAFYLARVAKAEKIVGFAGDPTPAI